MAPMWTNENRGRYNRSKLRYPSDLTDEQAGRDPSPTAAIIDSQSVKSAEKGGRASIPLASTLAKRSKARSAISL